MKQEKTQKTSTWIDENKILNLIKAVNEGLDEILIQMREDKVSKVIPVYESIQPPQSHLQVTCDSVLIPIEPIKNYYPRLPADILAKTEEVLKILEDEDVTIVAIDTGRFTYGPHAIINFVVINVGYWYYRYKTKFGKCANVSRLLSDITRDVDAQIRAKEFEKEVIDSLLDEVQGEKVFVLLDECLSLGYTLSFAEDARSEMINRVVEFIDAVMRKDAIPVGIFYTGASNIYGGILMLNPSVDIPRVSDVALMNRVLDQFSRSPLFAVYNRAICDKSLKILAFYIKVEEGNILRIEFPEQLRDRVDDIHSVVAFQSILGGGYPLALQRAHDKAVLDAECRRLILEEVCRRLGLPITDLILTKKQIRKARPVE
ncbi:MAG: DNA double-strand break repair nuclease NurA [Candidatus Korarchaeota archaeon]|nr:DNA double-strand break repair nuclease NurA [Thermoproteota archaeon]